MSLWSDEVKRYEQVKSPLYPIYNQICSSLYYPRHNQCHHDPSKIVVYWQTQSGDWTLDKFVDQSNNCGDKYATETTETNWKKYCAPTYSPSRIARAVMNDVCDDPNVTAKKLPS